MADFVPLTAVKSAVRVLSEPIETLAGIGTLIDTIIADNPFQCTAYQSGGVNKPGVEKTKEYYSGAVVYENNEGKKVGQITVNAPTLSGFNTSITTIMGNAALTTAIGGTPSNDSSEHKGSVTIKCHDANGELYNVSLNREKMTVTSYESDAIVTRVETWADNQAALA